jgi:hypothetical protein
LPDDEPEEPVRTSSARGFTLLELVFVSGLLGTVLLSIFSVAGVLNRTVSTVEANARTAHRARTVCRQLLRLLRPASVRSLAVDSGGTWVAPQEATAYGSVRFRIVEGYPSGSSPMLSPPITLVFVRDEREAANGIDDDRDGGVDEGKIVRISADGSRSAIASDLESFTVRKDSQTLTFVVQCLERDVEGRLFRCRFEESVSLRNN